MAAIETTTATVLRADASSVLDKLREQARSKGLSDEQVSKNPAALLAWVRKNNRSIDGTGAVVLPKPGSYDEVVRVANRADYRDALKAACNELDKQYGAAAAANVTTVGAMRPSSSTQNPMNAIKETLARVGREKFQKPGLTTLAGAFDASAGIYNALAQWTHYIEKKVGAKEGTVGEWVRFCETSLGLPEGALSNAAGSQAAAAQYYGERGFDPEVSSLSKVLAYVYGGVGNAAVNAPAVMTVGLVPFSAATGGAHAIEITNGESDLAVAKGAALGVANGLLMARLLRGLNELKVPQRYTAAGLAFAGQSLSTEMMKPSDQRDYEKVVGDAIVGLALVSHKPGGKGFKETFEEIKQANSTQAYREDLAGYRVQIKKAAAELKSLVETKQQPAATATASRTASPVDAASPRPDAAARRAMAEKLVALRQAKQEARAMKPAESTLEDYTSAAPRHNPGAIGRITRDMARQQKVYSAWGKAADEALAAAEKLPLAQRKQALKSIEAGAYDNNLHPSGESWDNFNSHMSDAQYGVRADPATGANQSAAPGSANRAEGARKALLHYEATLNDLQSRSDMKAQNLKKEAARSLVNELEKLTPEQKTAFAEQLLGKAKPATLAALEAGGVTVPKPVVHGEPERGTFGHIERAIEHYVGLARSSGKPQLFTWNGREILVRPGETNEQVYKSWKGAPRLSAAQRRLREQRSAYLRGEKLTGAAREQFGRPVTDQEERAFEGVSFHGSDFMPTVRDWLRRIEHIQPEAYQKVLAGLTRATPEQRLAVAETIYESTGRLSLSATPKTDIKIANKVLHQLPKQTSAAAPQLAHAELFAYLRAEQARTGGSDPKIEGLLQAANQLSGDMSPAALKRARAAALRERTATGPENSRDRAAFGGAPGAGSWKSDSFGGVRGEAELKAKITGYDALLAYLTPEKLAEIAKFGPR